MKMGLSCIRKQAKYKPGRVSIQHLFMLPASRFLPLINALLPSKMDHQLEVYDEKNPLFPSLFFMEK